MNKEVSFPIAKLLKEKGFDERSEPYRYNSYGELTLLEGINAPTIAEVVMWLYEKHGIWIVAWKNPDNPSQFYFEIDTPVKRIGDLSLGLFNSPAKAYEAAIEYCLNNLNIHQ